MMEDYTLQRESSIASLCQTFSAPTDFCFWNGNLLISQASDLYRQVEVSEKILALAFFIE